MAKKPKQSSSASRQPLRPRGGGAEEIEASEAPGTDDLEAELSEAGGDLDGLEDRLSAGLAEGDLDFQPMVEGGAAAASASSAAASESSPQTTPPVPDHRRPAEESDGNGQASTASTASRPGAPGPKAAKGGKFGVVEWAALGGFGLVALIGGGLFFKFLYAHPAPLQGAGVPAAFDLPLSGPSVRLAGAEAGWRDRVDGDTARLEERILPTVVLTLDTGQASAGFVRVEFIDPEDRIRGDVLTVAIEGGRFQDSGRGARIGPDGTSASLTGTVGFRSEALLASYFSGEEARWSVRIKEGPDSADGPWTEIGAARIPNKKLSRP